MFSEKGLGIVVVDVNNDDNEVASFAKRNENGIRFEAADGVEIEEEEEST